MNKNKWIIYFLIVVVLCSVMVFVRIIFHELNLSGTLIVVFGCVIFNAFIFVIGYPIFQKIRMFTFIKFILYFLFASTASAFVNFLLTYVSEISSFSHIVNDYFLFYILGSLLLLAVFNFTLSRIIFALGVWKSCLMGLLISSIDTIFLLPTFYK